MEMTVDFEKGTFTYIFRGMKIIMARPLTQAEIDDIEENPGLTLEELLNQRGAQG